MTDDKPLVQYHKKGSVMFFKIINHGDSKEVLYNADHISKIEMGYMDPPDSGGMGWRTSLSEGGKNPEAIRCYTIYVAGEPVRLAANPGDPVLKLIEDMFKNAVG
jgi:hypothetical protein